MLLAEPGVGSVAPPKVGVGTGRARGTPRVAGRRTRRGRRAADRISGDTLARTGAFDGPLVFCDWAPRVEGDQPVSARLRGTSEA